MAQSPFSQWQQPGPDLNAGWEFSSPVPRRPPAWAPCLALTALSAPPGYIATSSSPQSSGSLGFPTTDGQWLACPGSIQQQQHAQQEHVEVIEDLATASSCSCSGMAQPRPSLEVDPPTAAPDYGGYWEPLARPSFEAYHSVGNSMVSSIRNLGTAAPVAAAGGAGVGQHPEAGLPAGPAPNHPQHLSMFSWGSGLAVPPPHQYNQQQQQPVPLYPAAAAAAVPTFYPQPQPQMSHISSIHTPPAAGATSSSSSSSSVPAVPPTLLCCTPPSLPSGLAAELHLFLSGSVPSPAAAAAAAGWQVQPAGSGAVAAVYRLQLTHGQTVVLEADGWCSASDPVISVSVPPLASGILHLHLSFPNSSSSSSNGSGAASSSIVAPAITHPLLILPGAAASELSSYWSDLLVAAASRSSSGGVLASSGPGHTTAPAAPPWPPAAARAASGPAVWSMQVQVNGQLQVLTVQPSTVQAAWHQQYMPLVGDILSLIAPAPASGPTNTLTGHSQHSCGHLSDPQGQAREKLAGLVERLAVKGMWALLQLLTDQVFGGGSSAKALFSANMAAAAAATAAGVAAPAVQGVEGLAPEGGAAAAVVVQPDALRRTAPQAAAGASPAASVHRKGTQAAGSTPLTGTASRPAASSAGGHKDAAHTAADAGSMAGAQTITSVELQRSTNTHSPPDQQPLQGGKEQGSSARRTQLINTSSSCCQRAVAGSLSTGEPAADLAAALPQTTLTRRVANAAASHDSQHTSASSSGGRSSSCAGRQAAPSCERPSSSSRHSRLISSADVAARTGSLEMPEWFEAGLLHVFKGACSLTSASSSGSDGIGHVEWLGSADSVGTGQHTPAVAGPASGQVSSADSSSDSSDPATTPNTGGSGIGNSGLPWWLYNGLLLVMGLLDVAVVAALLAWLLRAL